MGSHGRLITVIVVLMVSMTGGALVLLALEGKPIKPMAFSLSSEIQMRSINQVMGTDAGIQAGRWKRVEICYEASKEHPMKGDQLSPGLTMQYHFIIGDGRNGQDGEVYASHRWIKQYSCLDPAINQSDEGTIRVCLMGNPSVHRSTPRQARQLETLVSNLNRHCGTDFPVSWKAL